MKREEAIECIRGFMGQLTEGCREALVTAIPELRESEDERIRRTLVEYFGPEVQLDFVRGVPIQKIRDWLEKQKEQNSNDVKREWWNKGYLEGRKNAHIPARELGLPSSWDFQKEQKPVLTAKEAWKEMRLEVYAQASGNRHEPNCSDDSTKIFSLCDIDEIIEKIGDSIVDQKPAWSEEEKDNISILLCMIDSMDSISLPSGTLRISGEKRRELKEFIKRPSWKPSEEQMKALEVIVRYGDKESTHIKSIHDLYEQLKQL